MKVDSGTVWRALASPHRRTLLDLLRGGPRSTGELCKELPELSRFAVMQHLGVLAEAGLVLYRREGRKRLNYANPVPLREIYERWVNEPASRAAETALRLRDHIERERGREGSMDQIEFRNIKIETEMPVRAPREKVFAAFTSEYDDWWPHRYKPDSRCSVDARPGGHIYEHFANGGGAVTGTLVYVDPPYKIASTGPSALHRGIDAFSVQTLEEDGEGGTIVKHSMEIWGRVSAETEQMFRDGSRHLMGDALKGYLEQAIRYSAGGAR